jgi:NhaC family Na+:H+ antiporter
MVYTSGPSYLIAGIVYLVAVKVPGSNGTLPPAAQRLLNELSSIYSLSSITLLPIIIVVIGIAQRTPPVIAIVISSAVAALTGMALQGFSLTSVLKSAVQGFNVTMLADKGVDPHSLAADTLALLNRGGMYSMSNTLLLIIAAFLLAGAMDVSGALDRLINQLLKMVNSTFALIAATMASGLAMISLTSNNSVTCLVVGELFQKAYDERGFARENLSRSMEDSVTIVEPLLPWTVSAVYMATTLGVPTISYAPWAVFCFGGPVFSLLYAATYDRLGFGLRRARA